VIRRSRRPGHPAGRVFARKRSPGTLQRMEVEGKSPSGHGPGGRSAVGIMLADPGHRPATEAERRRLADAVAQRGWSLSLRTGIATALADLCLAERDERARESWGLPPRHDLVLLIVGGFDDETLDVLVRALGEHAPRTGVYRWNGRRIVPHESGGPPPGDEPEDADTRHRRRSVRGPGTAAHDPIDGPSRGRDAHRGRPTGATVGSPRTVTATMSDAASDPRHAARVRTGDAGTHPAGITESTRAATDSLRRIAP
jgi:hypothetical protein